MEEKVSHAATLEWNLSVTREIHKRNNKLALLMEEDHAEAVLWILDVEAKY